MAFKTIKLTEDHISLIKNIKFEAFTIGEMLDRNNVIAALNLMKNDKEMFTKFNELYTELDRLSGQLETLSYQKECYAWGVNQWSLFGGTYAMEDIALAIGKFDQYIKGTEEDPLGRQFPKELEDYMWSLYHDIADNMEYIVSLVLFYTDKGGLTPGTYKCKVNDKIWKKVE